MIEALEKILDILNRLDKVTDAVPKPAISDIVKKNIIPSEGGSTFDVAEKVRTTLTSSEKQRVINTARIWNSVTAPIKAQIKPTIDLKKPEDKKPEDKEEQHGLIDYAKLSTTLVSTYFKELQRRSVDSKEKVIEGSGLSLSKKEHTVSANITKSTTSAEDKTSWLDTIAKLSLIAPAIALLGPAIGAISKGLPLVLAAYEGFQAVKGIITEEGRKEVRANIEAQTDIIDAEGLKGAAKNFATNITNPGKALAGIVVGAYDTIGSIIDYVEASYKADVAGNEFKQLADIQEKFKNKQIDQAKLLQAIKTHNADTINEYINSLQDKSTERTQLDAAVIRSKALLANKTYKAAGDSRSILAAMLAAGKAQGLDEQAIFEDFKAKSEEYTNTKDEKRKQELKTYFHNWQVARDKIYNGLEAELPTIPITPKGSPPTKAPIHTVSRDSSMYPKIEQVLAPPISTESTTTFAPPIEPLEATTTPAPMIAPIVNPTPVEVTATARVDMSELQEQLSKSHNVLQRIAFFGEESYKVLKSRGTAQAQAAPSNQVSAPVMRGGDSVNKPDSRASYFNSAYSLNVPGIAN